LKPVPKQAMVVNTSLGMKKGKIAAQVAHASLSVFLNSDQTAFHEGGFEYYFHNQDAEGEMASAIRDWFRGKFTKIVLQGSGEDELKAIYLRAKDAGLPCSLIQDAGETQVPPGSYTACAVGPGPAELVDKITGGLRLL
jgi:peptidyl-tRNA hydrolase, PTH2 family